MLSEDYTVGVLEDEEYLRILQDNEGTTGNVPVFSAVYEKLLRVLHQNPSRLKELADVIKRLGSDIVSEEFITMYKQFDSVARRLKK